MHLTYYFFFQFLRYSLSSKEYNGVRNRCSTWVGLDVYTCRHMLSNWSSALNDKLSTEKQKTKKQKESPYLNFDMFFFSLKRSTWCVLSRHLSSAQTKAALKPFYFAVHPDLFGRYPLQRVSNFIDIFFSFCYNVYIKESYHSLHWGRWNFKKYQYCY